jgi:ATP-binding cassette subfamily C protein CydCD
VLDEPTAHLDPDTARELIRDVFEAAEHHTVLLITHRDEGLELVDRVFRLESESLAGDELEARAVPAR